MKIYRYAYEFTRPGNRKCGGHNSFIAKNDKAAKEYAHQCIPEDATNVKLRVWTASRDSDILLDTIGSNLFIGKTILSRYVKPRKRSA